MANARFRALGSNHYPLPVYSVITMTTTQRLPSFVAKTIEILIKAFFFSFYQLLENIQILSSRNTSPETVWELKNIFTKSHDPTSASPKPSLHPSQQLRFYRAHKFRFVWIFDLTS